jgi:hypothetical protein
VYSSRGSGYQVGFLRSARRSLDLERDGKVKCAREGGMAASMQGGGSGPELEKSATVSLPSGFGK